MMDSQRQNAYLKLIRDLLECPSGQEVAILMAKPDLVDAGLVETMEQAAAVMAEISYDDAASLLRGLASWIAGGIGYSSPVGYEEIEEYLQFLIRVLNGVENSQGNFQAVASFLQANADKLDKNLASIVRVWAKLTFTLVPLHLAERMAQLMAVFGAIIKDFAQGDKSSNFEIAIAGFESAMLAYPRDEFSTQWAANQNTMGNAYKERMEGDKAENIEKAIACYQHTFQVYTRARHPLQWARSYFNMGGAYIQRIQGDRTENLERAIACYENALQVFTPDAYPKESAWARRNLEIAREDLRQGEIDTPELAIQPVPTVPEAEQRFLISVLRATWRNLGKNPQEMYSLLQANLEKLDDNFPRLLRTWVTATLAGASPNRAIKIAAVMYYFSKLMLDFTQGNRENQVEISIVCSEIALQVFTRAAFPEQWAETQINLGIAYEERLRGEQAEKWEQAIACYKNAEQVLTRSANAEQWAEVQDNLGNAYRNRVDGDQEENIERAIAYYENALQVRTREAYPRAWGVSKHNLGTAYLQRLRGEQEENREKAILNYEEALQVLTRETFPDLWALTQMSLGNAYTFRLRGNIAENWLKAGDYYQDALQVYTAEAFPYQHQQVLANMLLLKQQVQKLMDDFSVAVADDQAETPLLSQLLTGVFTGQGDPSENLEKDIAAYEIALQQYQPNPKTETWASLQNLLGNAYNERFKGRKQENIEKAIAAYQEALSFFKFDTHPENWAMVQMNLGNAYSERSSFGKTPLEDLKTAITCYGNALRVRHRENLPQEWADVQINLARSYYLRGMRLRHTQNGAEDFERAIQCSKNALLVYSRDISSEKWGIIQHNLGLIYSDRIKGDTADNLEKALANLKAVLEVRTRDEFPFAWAETQMNLAAIYGQRILGKREGNIEFIIDCAEKALQVFTYEKYPVFWAKTNGNLGNAYKLRIYGEPAENLEKAISHYNNALRVFNPHTSRLQWIETLFNLGTSYKNLGQHKNPEQNLEKAIECYQNALRVMHPQVYPFEWADLTNSLGNAYRHRVRGDRAQNYKEAFRCFQEVLQVHTRERFPKNYIQALGNRGNAYLEIGQLTQAYGDFKEAIDTVESLRLEITSGDEAKRKLAEEWNRIYQHMVKTCLDLGKTEPHYYAEALEYVERSKARNLLELLNSRELPKAQIPEKLWTELQRLRIEIDSEQRILEDAESFAGLEHRLFKMANPNLEIVLPDRTKLNQLQQQFNQKLAEAKRTDPNFSLTQQVELLPFKGIQGLLPDENTAIIQWYIMEYGEKFCTFIVTRQSVQPIVWESTLKDLNDLQEWWKDYFKAYETQEGKWKKDLADRLKRLAEILHIEEIEKIIGRLPKTCDQVILVPHRFLHLLPLHAIPLGGWPCLLDRFDRGVRYAPSCQALLVSQNRQRPNFERMLAIQNPTQDLDYAEIEVQNILHHFNPTKVLVRQQATKHAMTVDCADYLYSSHCVHFSCHGTFEQTSPLESPLILADKPLQLREIFSLDLRQCRLVTLSACETGMTDFTSISDEYIGLPSGFLYAGSPSVVSSQWSVNDLSTAFLLIRFYHNVCVKKLPIPLALNQAQRWLRDATKEELQQWTSQLLLNPAQNIQLMLFYSTIPANSKPFESPYHWAAFCYIGQ
jgi:CHAT domain-containing protein